MSDFKMPEWMECTWRRVPCGRDDCPLCGKINKQRQKHTEKGGDSDDLECAFEDVSVGSNVFAQIKRKDLK